MRKIIHLKIFLLLVIGIQNTFADCLLDYKGRNIVGTTLETSGEHWFVTCTANVVPIPNDVSPMCSEEYSCKVMQNTGITNTNSYYIKPPPPPPCASSSIGKWPNNYLAFSENNTLYQLANQKYHELLINGARKIDSTIDETVFNLHNDNLFLVDYSLELPESMCEGAACYIEIFKDITWYPAPISTEPNDDDSCGPPTIPCPGCLNVVNVVDELLNSHDVSIVNDWWDPNSSTMKDIYGSGENYFQTYDSWEKKIIIDDMLLKSGFLY